MRPSESAKPDAIYNVRGEKQLNRILKYHGNVTNGKMHSHTDATINGASNRGAVKSARAKCHRALCPRAAFTVVAHSLSRARYNEFRDKRDIFPSHVPRAPSRASAG